uniref:ribosomal protein L13 n=1 Tax=Chattonella marina TaxID=90936 RepID=UPI00211554E6|nr:ribosomal protein L13 [Chattonella marina]UTE94769.1 ribosomal protein L13 [Chattonella marina]
MKETFVPSKAFVRKKWYVIDAKDQNLGRLATEVASFLRGKYKPYFTPYLDTGDYIIVINADKIKVTGNKKLEKLYRHHSGRPGGMKIETFEKLQARIPERIIEKSVKGMLPKGALGREVFRKLYVYSNDSHPHQAQKPEKITL